MLTVLEQFTYITILEAAQSVWTWEVKGSQFKSSTEQKLWSSDWFTS